MIFINASAQEEIRFMDGSLAAILSIAKEKNKNIFIDTYADWCKPCKRMEEKFKNRDVADFFNEHFINLRVNMQNPTRANELRRKYDVVFLPTMYILDPNGVVKYHVDKELSVDELLNAAQRSLDPNSYHVSDATTVMRNDGTVTGNIKTSNPTKNSPPKNHTPKQIITNSEVVTANPIRSKNKPIDPSTNVNSISKATQRAKILESYETVDESSDKVLAVLGQGEMPPQVLKQEAYLRLEFMDGSHRKVAQDYLNSQSDWHTNENIKFVHDFVHSTYSKEYEFLIENIEEFKNVIGEKKVDRTLQVLIYRTLHNAVPRPTLEESITLYGNLDQASAQKKGYHYYINRLISDEDVDQIKEVSTNYLRSGLDDHEMRYTIGRYMLNKKERTEEQLSFATRMLEEAVNILPSSVIYLDQLALAYSDAGKMKEAKEVYLKAITAAKEQGMDYQAYEGKSQTNR